MIGILPSYNTMKYHCSYNQFQVPYQVDLYICCKMSIRYLTYHEMSATINKCQVSYLEMLGTYLIAGIHELQQV